MAWNKYDLSETKALLLETLVELKEEREVRETLSRLYSEQLDKNTAREEETTRMREYIRKLEAELADLKKGGLNHD